MEGEMRIPTRLDLVTALEERDGYVCQYPDCDKPFSDDNSPTVDHWYPQVWCKEQGWTPQEIWSLDNLKLMHKSCNAKKGHLIPNDDGTLPVKETRVRIPKSERPQDCDYCYNGRVLLLGEECDICGSGPQPATAPRSLQKHPKDCDHDDFHCWMCFIGHVPRKSAIERIIGGP